MNEITSLENITRAESDIAITTAKNFPRSISKFRQDAMTMATIDEEVAASCFYRLSRGGKTIEGPSVRLAEIVASAWGNLTFGARIIEEGEKFVVAQGIAHDLEKNVRTTVEVRRRITNKEGQRYNDDMISTTCNAACSIALRNAIFKTIPFTYAKVIFEQAKKTAIGSARTLGDRRQQMVEAFGKMGVSQDMVLGAVQKISLEDVGLSEIETLIGVFTAIKDGETTIEEQFPDAEAEQVTPEQADLEKKSKKKRAELNKLLAPTVSRQDVEIACMKFEAEHTGIIWPQLTYTRKDETFRTLSDQYKDRAKNNARAVMARIQNVQTKEGFYNLLTDYKAHPDLDTTENEEIITAQGKALGCPEYFADESEAGE